MESRQPRILVFSTLFPNASQPGAGVFIRERMFRVAKHLPLMVVAPVPWFPFQGIIRLWRPHFRPQPPGYETQDGIEVLHPRFLCIPGIFKSLDGVFLALSCYFTLRRLARTFEFNLIDAHFAYPDGYAATLLGKWFSVPVTITLRGTEVPQSRSPILAKKIVQAVQRATRVFAVAGSLRQHVMNLGANGDKIRVVGNGVDTDKFHPVDRQAARSELGVPENAKVLVSVGGLVERKGFHRVIECLPDLIKDYPGLHYLIIGGACAEGDMSEQLTRQVSDLGLDDKVHFLGHTESATIKYPLSAADVFVLSTSNEGWANVFLEAMACGLPVITTDVGGNKEVVCDSALGTVVTFGDKNALKDALQDALNKRWDKEYILQYARDNSWESRVDILLREFNHLVG